MSRRTTVQLAFIIIGFVIWGYGQRIDEPRIRLVGIAFFAVATILRFFRDSHTRPPHEDDEADEPADLSA